MLTITPYAPNKKRSNVKFEGAYYDLGASDRYCATFKEAIIDKGIVIFRDSQKLCPKGINGPKHFVRRIASKIKHAQKILAKTTGKKLEEIIIFTTGRPVPTKGGSFEIERMRTILDHDGHSLEHVKFSYLQKKFPHIKINVFNDMIGASCAVVNRLKPEAIPNNGLVITTGGGFGTSYFKKVAKDGAEYIKISESRDGRREIGNEALEDYGAAVPSLIRNFCKALKMSDKSVEKAIKDGDARIVTMESPEFIDKNNFEPELMQKASKKAINKYSEAIAHCIKLKTVDDGEELNHVYLSGRLIDGIDRYIKGNPQIWNKEELSLEKLIKSYLNADAGAANIDKVNNVKFSIISDIKDNTEGGVFLESKKFVVEKEKERNQNIVSILVPMQ